jgi:hypothetical protein
MGGQGLMSSSLMGTGGNAQDPSYGNQNLQNPAVFNHLYRDNSSIQGGFADSAYRPNPNADSAFITGDLGILPTTGDYGSGPVPVGNFGGINSLVPNQPNRNNFANNGPIGTGLTTPTQNPYGANPYANSKDPFIQASQQTQFGNVIGAERATAANRVNQQTPFGNLTYAQTGVDANGNPIYSANQTFSPEVAGTMSNISNQINRNIGQGFNPQLPSYGINPNEAYSDAILRRLEPVQQRQQEALNARLANQGIMQGSEAYKNAMTDFGQRQNDQLTSAIVGGMQTGLQANQQAYNQAFGNYNLPLAQLGAYRQATSPNYVNPYTQAAVAGPDLLGAYTSSEAARIAQQNADAARQAALTGGLFQLGGSAISNPSAISGMGGLIGKGIDYIGGLF